jgi:hypothetical protein
VKVEDVERLAENLPNGFDPVAEDANFVWGMGGGGPGFVQVYVGPLSSTFALLKQGNLGNSWKNPGGVVFETSGKYLGFSKTSEANWARRIGAELSAL